MDFLKPRFLFSVYKYRNIREIKLFEFAAAGRGIQ